VIGENFIGLGIGEQRQLQLKYGMKGKLLFGMKFQGSAVTCSLLLVKCS
jgi:hypothetical protein